MQTKREVLAAVSSSAAGNDQSNELTLVALVEQYMQEYTGRDRSIASRLERWVALLGDRAVSSLTDDDVFAGLERIGNAPAELFSGYDVRGRPVYRSRGRKRSGATANRYKNALAGMFRWAIRRRRVPRGFANPCRGVPKWDEPPGRTRFLTPDERDRLLSACKASRWERLYAIVLIAITTGARRGEISALTWADVNLEERRALVRESKNGSQRTLPLTGSVVTALRPLYAADARRFKQVGSKLIFPVRLAARSAPSVRAGLAGSATQRSNHRVQVPRLPAHRGELPGAARREPARARRFPGPPAARDGAPLCAPDRRQQGAVGNARARGYRVNARAVCRAFPPAQWKDLLRQYFNPRGVRIYSAEMSPVWNLERRTFSIWMEREAGLR